MVKYVNKLGLYVYYVVLGVENLFFLSEFIEVMWEYFCKDFLVDRSGVFI